MILPISDFIEAQNCNQTRAKYRSGVIRFLTHIYRKPEGVNKNVKDLQPYEIMANQYLKEKKDYSKDIISFIRSLQKEKMANLSIRSYVTAVKTWLIFSKMDLTAYQMMMIRKATPSSKRGATHEDILDEDKIRQIISHSSIKLQAVVLTMCSSGMRPGEVVSIDKNDMDMETNRVWIRDTKTGEARYTFISKEANQSIEEWLKVRDKYILTAKKRHFTEEIDDSKLFPFSYRLVLDMWTQALRKSGLHNVDSHTNRITLRPHACRKFFSSQLSKTNIGDSFIELLMGHEDGVKSVYKKFTEKDVYDKYEEFEYAVTIHKGNITKEIKQQNEKIDQQSNIIHDLANENLSFKNGFKDREEIERKMEIRMNRIEEQNKQLTNVIRYILQNQHKLLSENDSFDKQLSDLMFDMEQTEKNSMQIYDYIDPKYMEKDDDGFE